MCLLWMSRKNTVDISKAPCVIAIVHFDWFFVGFLSTLFKAVVVVGDRLHIHISKLFSQGSTISK